MFVMFDIAMSAKSMAVLYLMMAILSGVTATTSSGLMSLEMMSCYSQNWENSYYSLVTMHGVLFVFLVLTPIAQFYINYMLPGLAGLEDLYLPRINMMAVMGTMMSLIMVVTGWMISEGPSTGWTFYPPLSTSKYEMTDLFLSGLHLMGLSGMLSGVNVMLTTMMSLSFLYKNMNNLSLFMWCQLLTSILFMGSAPGLTMAMTGVMTDSSLGFCWFDPAGGGDPMLFQTLFWFFGHPEVYVMMLPAFAVINLSFEMNKSFHGKAGIILSLMSLGMMSFLVYGHHMFTVDLEMETQLMFTSGTMSMAIPTGVKVFSWLYSYKSDNSKNSVGAIPFMCFLITFMGGGITGMTVSSCTVDIMLHDSQFMVGHFHQVMAMSVMMGFMIGMPMMNKNTSENMNSMIFNMGLLMFTVSTMCLFTPMYYCGIQGMPSSAPCFNTELLMENYNSSMSMLLSQMGMMVMMASS